MPDTVKDESGKEKETLPDKSIKDDKEQDDPLRKLSNEIFARIGRLDAEHKKDRQVILAKLDEVTAKSEVNRPMQQGYVPVDSMKAMNDKLTERALGGDFYGAVDEAFTTRQRAELVIQQRAEAQMEKVLSGMENVKYFGDVKESVKTIASNLLGQGYSPQDAVAFAYEKARADHLDKLVSRGTEDIDTSGLETLDGGGRHEDAGSRKGKLNPDGRKAWEKNKGIMHSGKPLFENEAAFIASMAPAVRAKFVG